MTFGGGEPLLYADFFPEFRTLCGTSWKLYTETSLYVPEENIRIAAQVMDGFIVDIKDTNPEIYHAYTEQDVTRAMENLRLLITLTDPEKIRVRLPLIPGYNTEEDRTRSESILQDIGITDLDKFKYIVR